MSEEIRLEIADHIARVTLARPPVNALDEAAMRSLIAAFDTAGATAGVKAVVLTATGRTFCAGSDIKSRASAPNSPDLESAYNELARELNISIADCAVPVIVSVNGDALGGGLAMVAAGDIVVVAAGAHFGLPEINVGLLGGASWAARLFGSRWARRMMLTGDRFTAAELIASGSFAAAILSNDPDMTALALASEIASKSPTATRLAKTALNDIEFMELRAAYRHEQSFTSRLRGHPDSAEAMAAFLERREAVYRDDTQ